jgi:hypothetical protein
MVRWWVMCWMGCASYYTPCPRPPQARRRRPTSRPDLPSPSRRLSAWRPRPTWRSRTIPECRSAGCGAGGRINLVLPRTALDCAVYSFVQPDQHVQELGACRRHPRTPTARRGRSASRRTRMPSRRRHRPRCGTHGDSSPTPHANSSVADPTGPLDAVSRGNRGGAPATVQVRVRMTPSSPARVSSVPVTAFR